MEPYVIKQGDYVARLAYKFGFDADEIWNDPANGDLQALRKDQNILWPTDILHIPDQVDKEPATFPLVTGQTNTFVCDTPTVSITIKFTDTSLAGQPFTVPEVPSLTDQTTGADGSVTLPIPVTLDTFTIAFTQSGATFEFKPGGLDPMDTLSGVFQRLYNLGFLGDDASADPLDVGEIRVALRAFKALQSAGGSAPSGSTDIDGDVDDGAQDNAGLSDDGTLDASTRSLLLEAYGS
jgi:hypothetical protein